MKTLLVRLLLRGRKEYSDIVRIRKKNYRVTIEEFIPATECERPCKTQSQNLNRKFFKLRSSSLHFTDDSFI